MQKCPKCESKMKLVKGKYPWIEWYLVCLKCDYSEIMTLETKNPSSRIFGEKKE